MATNPEIIIYCRKISPRLEYVAGFLTSALIINFRVAKFDKPDMDRICYSINYSDKPAEGLLNISDNGLLHETDIRPLIPDVENRNGVAILFPAPPQFDLPFDIFSAIFYMLSRYEEYLPFTPDGYGRFEANRSFTFSHGFIEMPVVDHWVLMLKKAFKSKFSGLEFPERKFMFRSTIDIDSPWVYKYKGVIRNTGGIIKQIFRGDFKGALNRMDVLSGRVDDPFDTYSYIREIEERNGFSSVYFFLSGDYGHFDVNHALKTSAFRDLIRQIGADRQVGIHPSFRSNDDISILRTEFSNFAMILGKQPVMSRQHFLVVKLPDTYNRLTAQRITDDYSMGYATAPGFRAGTSLPFRFYDLAGEKETNLTIHPFTVMDVTLKQYLGLGPEDALLKIKTLIEKVKTVNGIFTSLWHNESLSDQGEWKGWRYVFEEMVRYAN